MTKNVKHILSAFLVLSLVLCTFAVSAESGEIVFENPLYMQETFEAVKSPLVAESGTSEAYSQYVSAKYWNGDAAENISANGGITFSTAKESLSVSSTYPISGSYIFDFDITHPDPNSLQSAIYIGVRNNRQFTDMTEYSLSSMPLDGIWLGISYTNVGIGTGIVSGSNSVCFNMGADFSDYTSFRVYDDRINNIVSYYAVNGDTSTLFATVNVSPDAESNTTTLTYSINAPGGEETYTVTVDGLISSDPAQYVYPQLQMNKYLCSLNSFAVTCQGNIDAGLTDIKITGAEVSPEISLDVKDYTIKTPSSGEITLNITGASTVKYAVMADGVPTTLLSGDNTINIAGVRVLTITADNGVTETVYTFTFIDNTHTVTLIPTYCTIEAADDDGSKTLTVMDGESAVFTVMPIAGYDFVSVSQGAVYSEKEVNLQTVGTVTVENVTSDCSFEIIFEQREPIYLTVGSAVAARGETIDIPVSIAENSGATAGAFNILYDADRLDFIGGITTGCLSVGNRGLEPTPIPGKLGFYFISRNLGQTPITDSGVLIYARFTVKDNAEDGDAPIEISLESNGTTRPEISDKDGARLVDVTNGIITFLTPDDGKHILKTAVADGIGGTVVPGGRYAEGEQISLTATAATGYTFSHWEADNGTFLSPDDATSVFVMGDSDTTATAHFKRKTFAVTTQVIGGEGGEIIPSTDLVEYGGSVTVTLNPYPGYEISAFTVNGSNKLDKLENNTYSLSSIKRDQAMVVTYTWVGADIINNIIPLRSYDVSYSNLDRTITVKASDTNTSAGFALDVADDETFGSYEKESGKNLSQGISAGRKYIVARRSAGNLQTFELYVEYAGHKYTYNVTFMFTDDPENVTVVDFAAENAYTFDVNKSAKTVKITTDRKNEYVSLSFIVPDDTQVQYELTYSSSGGTAYEEITSESYVTSSGNSGYGQLVMYRLPRSNGVTQKVAVTVSDSSKTNTYQVSIAFRYISYEADVRPDEFVPLRLSILDVDYENKVIYAEAASGITSAGFSYKLSGNPPVKFTCQSGQGLVYGDKDGYRYIVNRRVNGNKQTYKVKVFAEDGYGYSWYTVVMKYA